MTFNISPTVIIGFITICTSVGPAFFFFGRLSKRVDALEATIKELKETYTVPDATAQRRT